MVKKELFLIALLLLVFSCKQDSSVIIKMENVSGVYMVPAKVNGLSLKFIFDTGASEVSISLTEAIFMAKNGYLDEDDIVGTSFAQLADGSVTENTRINLKSIEIGELKIHDVSATIIHNSDAPLLLGQSAIKRLGRIEFDGDCLIIHTSAKANRNNNAIIDEKSQAILDSLICLAYNEYKSSDYIFAQKHIRKARLLSINSHLTNQIWEIDYIDGLIRGALAASTDDAWIREMPLFRSAFHANTEHKDGVCVEYVKLLLNYAYGLAQHYSPNDGTNLNDTNMSFEDEFSDVISLLMERNKYSAYTCSAIYYSKNFNVAKKYCEKAIAIDSTKSNGYVELGKTYYSTAGYKEQAIKYYEKALTLSDADSAYIYRLLAMCYPYYSDEFRTHLIQAAKMGDLDAQHYLIETMGITW